MQELQQLLPQGPLTAAAQPQLPDDNLISRKASTTIGRETRSCVVYLYRIRPVRGSVTLRDSDPHQVSTQCSTVGEMSVLKCEF